MRKLVYILAHVEYFRNLGTREYLMYGKSATWDGVA